MMMMKYLT